jgi:hypothetical protein
MSYGPAQWLWTIYVGNGVNLVEAVPVAGVADTLDEAVAGFIHSFDRMIDAGCGRLPQ